MPILVVVNVGLIRELKCVDHCYELQFNGVSGKVRLDGLLNCSIALDGICRVRLDKVMRFNELMK